MIRLMLWTPSDDAAWIDNKEWASIKFQAMHDLRKHSKQPLHYQFNNNKLAEYWFEFATEEDLVLFKLTHHYDYETQTRRTTSV